MTTSEHLQRIKAKCESLLELASKRTPGKWGTQIYETLAAAQDEGFFEWASPINSLLTGPVGMVWSQNGNASAGLPGSIEASADNVTFIASCAGPAEAGWRATIAAIDGFQRLSKWNFPGWEGDHGIISEIEGEIDAILAAWPEEIL